MSESSIYRRPLSRAEKRHFSPWVNLPQKATRINSSYPYSNYLAFPEQPYFSQAERSEPGRKTEYGNCECLAGQCVVSKCKDPYMSVCDGPYGSLCTCTKIAEKDYGCQDKKFSYCPG